MIEIILGLVGKYPELASFFMVVGVLRSIFKPLQLVIDEYVKATPSDKDDSWWAGVKEHKVFKGLAWVLDYLASIKVK